MRKVTAGLFHSIDGVVEAPETWQFDRFDQDLGSAFVEQIKSIDAVILGRKGFEQWAVFWPTAGYDSFFSKFITQVPKFVASRTLKGAPGWENATLIEGDVPTFVRKLKAKKGGEIAVMGGIEIVRNLFLAGVIDELSLITHPVVAGADRRRLFEPDGATTRLALKSVKQTEKGNVVSVYTLAEEAA